MSRISGPPAPSPNLPPPGQTSVPLRSLTELLQRQGPSGWHLQLSQNADRTQAESLLRGFYQSLIAQPEWTQQLADLPNGKDLLNSLDAAVQGKLTETDIQSIQRFLSQTAGIDISYGDNNGIDGLLGPRTLQGLNQVFARLEKGENLRQPLASSFDNRAGAQCSALPKLSLFSNTTDPSQMYERSPYHDPQKFVPAYAMTAYHESGCYRSSDDPYGVGAITHPSKSDDLGGKTYGVYQFESSVYADGSRASQNKVAHSTLMRFVNWSGNPFGAQLRATVNQYGVASREFDQLWKNLAHQQNQVFGTAQEQFLQHEKEDNVQRFLDRAQVSDEVRQDPRIFDLIMGTTNHVGGLANSAADHIASLQRQAGRKFSPDEVGRSLAEYKETQIASWFRSSPGAWDGLRNRFQDEGNLFA